ncbi:uncharacterized protein [Dermacentor albipictus]|uniref:uncharacterized protein isoform X2 n=1 Tax=Dermacentor albipictus TaxID=60249 RepID=UPI0038FC3863
MRVLQPFFKRSRPAIRACSISHSRGKRGRLSWGVRKQNEPCGATCAADVPRLRRFPSASAMTPPDVGMLPFVKDVPALYLTRIDGKRRTRRILNNV